MPGVTVKGGMAVQGLLSSTKRLVFLSFDDWRCWTVLEGDRPCLCPVHVDPSGRLGARARPAISHEKMMSLWKCSGFLERVCFYVGTSHMEHSGRALRSLVYPLVCSSYLPTFPCISEYAQISDDSFTMHSLEKLNKMSENSNCHSHRV